MKILITLLFFAVTATTVNSLKIGQTNSSAILGFPHIPGVSAIGRFFAGGTFENIINGNLESIFGGNWNRVQYCVVSSKISYRCVIPNIRFFIFTQLISFPFAFVGPTLSTVNIVYLLLNYLPYVIKDIACILKALALSSIPFPSIPFPHIPLPFLPYMNQTMLNQVMLNQTMLASNFTELMDLYNDYYANNLMGNNKNVELLFP